MDRPDGVVLHFLSDVVVSIIAISTNKRARKRKRHNPIAQELVIAPICTLHVYPGAVTVASS